MAFCFLILACLELGVVGVCRRSSCARDASLLCRSCRQNHEDSRKGAETFRNSAKVKMKGCNEGVPESLTLARKRLKPTLDQSAEWVHQHKHLDHPVNRWWVLQRV